MNHPLCRRCGVLTQLRRNVISNGTSQVFWHCDQCDLITPAGTFLPHDQVKAFLTKFYITIDDLPIVCDYRQPCVVCGLERGGSEYAHFFPQCFKDHPEVAPDWPAWDGIGFNLCKYHHDLWHDLVTPWMPGRGNSRKIGT